MGNGKTHRLGIISIDKFAKLPEWKAYAAATADFAKAKAASSAAKPKMKDALRKHSPTLKEVQNLEFYVMPSGREIAVIEQLKVSKQREGVTELEFD
jgi:hypothetical protein